MLRAARTKRRRCAPAMASNIRTNPNVTCCPPGGALPTSARSADIHPASLPGLTRLDPAIHLQAKKMDPRVKPAGDRWINLIETRSTRRPKLTVQNRTVKVEAAQGVVLPVCTG